MSTQTELQKKFWRRDTALNKFVKTKDLFESVPAYLEKLFAECEYPWEMLPKIKEYIKELIESGRKK